MDVLAMDELAMDELGGDPPCWSHLLDEEGRIFEPGAEPLGRRSADGEDTTPVLVPDDH